MKQAERKTAAFLLAAAMAIAPMTADAGSFLTGGTGIVANAIGRISEIRFTYAKARSLKGSGTKADPYIIHDTDDLDFYLTDVITTSITRSTTALGDMGDGNVIEIK